MWQLGTFTYGGFRVGIFTFSLGKTGTGTLSILDFHHMQDKTLLFIFDPTQVAAYLNWLHTSALPT